MRGECHLKKKTLNATKARMKNQSMNQIITRSHKPDTPLKETLNSAEMETNTTPFTGTREYISLEEFLKISRKSKYNEQADLSLMKEALIRKRLNFLEANEEYKNEDQGLQEPEENISSDESFDANDCYHEFQNMYYPKEDKGYLYMGSHTNTLKGRRILSLEEVDKFMNEFSSEHCLKSRKRSCFVKEKRSGL
jgi:hypothetical protein